jgi:hypothetical protein
MRPNDTTISAAPSSSIRIPSPQLIAYGLRPKTWERAFLVALPLAAGILLHGGAAQAATQTAGTAARPSMSMTASGCPATPPPAVVPIQSRVVFTPVHNAVNYYFTLGLDANNPAITTGIGAPEGPPQGFQVVYLRRTDLCIVSNRTIGNPNANGGWNVSDLHEVLGNVPAGCGAAGCLVLVQSLQTIGYTPCFLGQSNQRYNQYNQPTELTAEAGLNSLARWVDPAERPGLTGHPIKSPIHSSGIRRRAALLIRP